MRGPDYRGRVLGGRYEVGELLGEGGWGAVYAAVQRDLGRHVALKVLHVDLAFESDAVMRFEREARAAAAFGHPHIALVTDFQSNPGEPPFLVMERLTGETLGSLLARERVLPPGRVLAIVRQVLSALDVAHRAGIVHRDVKPDNVFLVSMSGVADFVKLLDFGIAKLSSPGQAHVTDAGRMLGSPAFMPPEQVRGEAVDPRADVYAVAATMYLALAGRLPFDAPNIPAMLTAIMTREPEPIGGAVDPRLSALVLRALAKDPALRFQSAAEMRAALEPWAPSTPAFGAAAPTLGSAPPAFASHDAAPSTSVAGLGTGGPMTMPVAPPSPGSAPRPPAAPTSGGGRPVVTLLVAIAVLLLLVLGGVTATFFFFLARSGRDAAASSAPPPASALATSAPASQLVPAPPAPAPLPSATSAATRVLPPGPAPVPAPPPSPVVVDAGSAGDAGGGRRAFGGVDPQISGGQYGGYDVAAGKGAVMAVVPQLRTCYAATEMDPPDHVFTSWTFDVDPSGAVRSVRRTTSADPHPKLDACVIAALRTVRWPALAGGGDPVVTITARPRSAP